MHKWLIGAMVASAPIVGGASTDAQAGGYREYYYVAPAYRYPAPAYEYYAVPRVRVYEYYYRPRPYWRAYYYGPRDYYGPPWDW